jgi:putative spermidine/putrescine transport system substrate-binding protein
VAVLKWRVGRPKPGQGPTWARAVVMKPFCLSRRQFWQWLPLGLAAPVRAAETLRVLAWPGYAEPEVVRAFEKRHQVKVEVTTIDSDEALWQWVSQKQGGAFDVFAVNTAELQRYIKAGLVMAVPTALLHNLPRQQPRFQALEAIPGLVHGGRPFAIPFTYSEMGLIYDRQQVPSAPSSISILWDERYRGKVVAYNGGTHNFSLAAQAMGLKSPFRLGAQDWPVAVDRLVALRRNAAGFYTRPDESVSLFKARQAAVMFANFGRQQLQLVRAAGVDAGYVVPREGSLAWLDCWALTRGARNPALAAAWIDHLLEDQASGLLISRQGLANTTSPGPGTRAEDRLLWLEPAESEERRNRLWARILSGDSAAKVLKP